jgi:hypothetical protein
MKSEGDTSRLNTLKESLESPVGRNVQRAAELASAGKVVCRKRAGEFLSL